ncbi:methylenetetrahydrofolate--tRNA-(uracil(54)-C(5))-methyltransferase (FADH(2)-oxidizing) TrmFO [Anaeromyxobacter sp. Fw109-5]|uniref:Methylenetetrahydrofolate--tRNA-(uracil-5-)-methyltransferase TrmFO n=1 Tax=Anaeromyxobacter sp. (strain Fw109-5) TaxID=404589 RepID=TRMFO_ANADF|nr:methylenetetrahydrofolate--tRNA-(uracil(54)-C(5))-methyltransferase (FADH(2)-oxidizing) TrmFO [Anaeromyxobacter sp. Fw109-5]A7HDU6.1 RecName: Full=Methylenetetrahydrofolate--tRNA-(uracil-5-)-methyltransferase TrmFO; AltName: Full=Folate-dependent tRNA (uracil-5-)-methyltransferase; AltName: Full=Folate-dependent tRNA(M-5-U54)-methyltransferase [Anaeromyxobacter sp. Fw109-5]ABS26892.1 gid protein [Anaeromyxobacter sp. Fw109-5]
MGRERVTVVGGGLAGSEAAWRLAQGGVEVELVEMKPGRRSPAHVLDGLAELVCSNSLRSDNPHNAVGLLHEELRRLGSLVLSAADATRVPAGDALAVDRERFSALVTGRLRGHPLVRVRQEELLRLPEGPGLTLVATGPLTGDALAADVAALAGGRLHFYDAIAPIVAADSIDMSIAYARSRYGKGSGDDYLNLPFDEGQYRAFVGALLAGEKVAAHDFEEPRYFEGCLPIEVMAERGADVLAYGPMKPVGLEDPRTGRRPFAVVQLRREDVAGTAYNLVGFQTRLTWTEQRRILREYVPGLAGAEFVRLGQIHRNTFLEAPRVLAPDLSARERPHLFFAGQITGVEGYVESAACGHLAARAMLDRLAGRPFLPPPAATALGALHRHLTGEAHPPGYDYQPTNVVFALFPPLTGRHRGKAARKDAHAERARKEIAPWIDPWTHTARGAAAP